MTTPYLLDITCISGSCTLLLNGEKRLIEAGKLDSVFIPSNCPHGLVNEGTEVSDKLFCCPDSLVDARMH